MINPRILYASLVVIGEFNDMSEINKIDAQIETVPRNESSMHNKGLKWCSNLGSVMVCFVQKFGSNTNIC